MQPELSIIIVSYNTKERTLETIASIPDREKNQIIVVDNNSSDNSANSIEKNFESVQVIHNSENVGFARAINQGLKVSKGNYFLLLNSDTHILGNAVEVMLKFLESHANLGIVSCVLKNPDGTIQMQGGFLPNIGNILAWMLFIDDLPGVKTFFPSYQLRDINRVSKPIEIGWVGGTVMMIKKEVVEKIGGFNEDFFMYGEDVEFCTRVRGAGYIIAITNGANVIHYGQQSLGGNPKNAIIGEYKAIKMLFSSRKVEWIVICFIMKLGALLRMFIFGILQGKRDYYDIYKQAYQVV